MEDFESLVANARPGTQEVYWENRGRPEYATPYDPPAPDVPITGTLEVTNYAVGFTPLAEHSVLVTNRLAPIEGHVEFYSASLTSTELSSAGAHAFALDDRSLPAHLSQWRVHIAIAGAENSSVDALLLNCTGQGGCEIAAQSTVLGHGATLAVDNPPEGSWKIVLRTRDRLKNKIAYRVQDALLSPEEDAAASGIDRHSSGAIWRVPLPAKTGDAVYVAFRIAGTAGKEDQKDGLRIAMTALTSGAP
jgi:hypothetical protein